MDSPMKPPATSPRQVWPDVVRIAAIFSVVMIHVSIQHLIRIKKFGIPDWRTCNNYDAAVRMAVPLFFMLTGYLLLSRREPLGVFFWKRMRKLVVPLVMWSLFYIAWERFWKHENLEFVFSLDPIGIVRGILAGPAYYHLWFMYAIVGLYLFIPLLRPLVQNASGKELWTYVILWFTASSLLPLLKDRFSLQTGFGLEMMTGFSGFLVFGKLLGELRISRKMALSAFLVYAASVCATSYLVLISCKKAGGWDPYYLGNSVPNTILTGVSAFIVLKAVAEHPRFPSHPRCLSILRELSACAYGIYLSHAACLEVINRLYVLGKMRGIEIGFFYLIPLKTFLVVAICFGVVWVMRRIPVIREAVP